jgi:hypothetical protein
MRVEEGKGRNYSEMTCFGELLEQRRSTGHCLCCHCSLSIPSISFKKELKIDGGGIEGKGMFSINFCCQIKMFWTDSQR